jgi:Protein of unknown function (DUF3800)
MKSSDDPNQRYLGLTGVIMRLEYERGQFTEAISLIKREVFGTDQIVFHRKEMLQAKPPFEGLVNADVRARLDVGLLELMSHATYRVFTVVIDKQEHRRRYRVWTFDPYHYCLTVALERYVQLLQRMGQVGDVMAESRGKRENMRLERAYRYIYNHGSDHVSAKVFQTHLSSKEIKMESKKANVSGLQMADMIANPSCRSLICYKTKTEMTAEFGRQIVETLTRVKYLKNPATGKIEGWGTKWLP